MTDIEYISPRSAAAELSELPPGAVIWLELSVSHGTALLEARGDEYAFDVAVDGLEYLDLPIDMRGARFRVATQPEWYATRSAIGDRRAARLTKENLLAIDYDGGLGLICAARIRLVAAGSADIRWGDALGGPLWEGGPPLASLLGRPPSTPG